MKKSSASEIVGVLAIQVVDASGRWQVAGPLFFFLNRTELKGDFLKWDFTWGGGSLVTASFGRL